MEKWKNIKSFPGYKVSNYGEIRSHRRKNPIILSKRINKKGYYYVNLMDSTSKTTMYRSVLVHSLVASTFLRKSNNNLCVNHLDGDKLNNKVSNLEWVTNKRNSEHAFKLGLVSGRKGNLCNLSKLNAKQVLKIRLLKGKSNLSYNDVALIFNVTKSTIIQIVQRKIWKHI